MPPATPSRTWPTGATSASVPERAVLLYADVDEGVPRRSSKALFRNAAGPIEGSGSVRLRLAPDAGFEAHADLGSGRIESQYGDARPILKRNEVVGYRRGDGRIRIDVETGSGSLTLEPMR
jgi:hypothetical protein